MLNDNFIYKNNLYSIIALLEWYINYYYYTLNKLVISSNCPTGPSEILDNGKGGLLFKVGDYKELSKKIIYTIQNNKKCNKKLLFAKKRLERFDYSKNLFRYYNILNTI